MPSRTIASRWTGDTVLCYMDARSTGAFGPEAEALFSWSSERFSRLLAYHDAPSDDGGGVPVDTMFESFVFSGNSWYNGKRFWPGLGIPMNKTDWTDFLSMQLTIGAANLDSAAANISSLLPFTQPSSCGGGLRPSVVLSIPYPDPRLQDWGTLDGPGSRSLNFSLLEDRTRAVQWWVKQAYLQWESSGFKHARLQGFYWFFEEIREWPSVGGGSDSILVPAVSQAIRALSSALMFVWVPVSSV